MYKDSKVEAAGQLACLLVFGVLSLTGIIEEFAKCRDNLEKTGMSQEARDFVDMIFVAGMVFPTMVFQKELLEEHANVQTYT